jgi:hypothetical protein
MTGKLITAMLKLSSLYRPEKFIAGRPFDLPEIG